ncbi:hypothetical protein Tco_0024465 [Tanacetum coccineum]
MIGCKVMRTLASVEIEIMLILGLPCCLSSSSVRCLESAYLDGTDIESEPFEEPVETETPESPLIVAPPTSPPESTPPTLVPILRRTAHMAVCVSPAMSPGLSASMAEVAAMSESAFRKRFRSSYESSPSSSPPNLPSRNRYRGTSELVEDDDEEDEEIEEILDSDSVSEDAEDEDPAAGDEGLAAGDEGPGMGVESRGLDDESHGLHDESRGLDDECNTSEKFRVLYNFTQEHGGLIHDHVVRLEELSPTLFERSLEHEQERVTVTFGALWRPVLALESWAGQTDAQRAALWHVISDT